MAQQTDPLSAPFGTLFGDSITVAFGSPEGYHYSGAAQPLANFSLHPGTHAFHYGSTCFEGLKAHRQKNGQVAIFRLDAHVERFQRSIASLFLPVPETDLLRAMFYDAAAANINQVPNSPGALYLRPTIIGTDPNIGAAGAPSTTTLLYVLTSPVGDYFAGGVRPLSILVETETPRTTPQFGTVKSGANYVMALGPTLAAKSAYGVDQVLFAKEGDTTETGASNFFLVDNERLITRNLDNTFLHGVTRASLIELAAELGYVIEERPISLEELLSRSTNTEMFLSGTAAVIAPVGSLIHNGLQYSVCDGQPGPNTLKIRQALIDLQTGVSPDNFGWRTPVTTS